MAKKLVLKACVLAGLVAIVECLILFAPFGRDAKNTYLDEWRTKHDRLIGPGHNRIVIAGGSNVAFGVDSAKIEMVMGRETVNLGLQGGLGLAFMLHEVEDGARAGDLIILIPEYEQFYGDVVDGELAAAELVQSDRSALWYFSSWRQWRNLVKNSTTLTSVRFFALIDDTKMALLRRDDPVREVFTVYHHGAFDMHGDMVAHLDQASKPAQVVSRVARLNNELNQTAVEGIAHCAEVLTARGAEFVVLYPAVAASYWAVNQDQAERVAAGLRGLRVLTKPADWVFEDRFFFDTPYHLNRSGRDVRTEQLVRVLRAVRRKDDSDIHR